MSLNVSGKLADFLVNFFSRNHNIGMDCHNISQLVALIFWWRYIKKLNAYYTKIYIQNIASQSRLKNCAWLIVRQKHAPLISSIFKVREMLIYPKLIVS